MYTRLSRQFVWFGLMALILLPGQAVSQEAQGIGLRENLVIQWDAASPITVLESGEVEVRTSSVILGRKGRSYSVTLSFQSMDDYNAALPRGAKGIRLGDLQTAWSLRSTDQLEQITRPRGKMVLDLAENAAVPVCGNAVARGLVRLEGGVYMGVSLHSPTTKEFVHDIHGACDFFAAGGCGSGACYNSDETGGHLTLGRGDCRELEVFGPNTCYCHTTSIVYMN